MSSLPPTHRALHLPAQGHPLSVLTLPTPQPTPGSAIVRIHLANILSYSGDIYNGTRKYPYPTPLIPGASSIGRVAALGPDAASLKAGDLVLVEGMIHARDEPSDIVLMGITQGMTEGSKKLMEGEWRNGTYAEFAKVPLENCVKLDEKRLLGKVEDGGLGYKMEDFAHIPGMLVPFGGLRDVDLKVGETVIVAPATGPFGGLAVHVALAMGARVIAMGRDTSKLDKLKKIVVDSGVDSALIQSVPITGDLDADTAALRAFGEADAFFDISPPFAAGSTHIKSGIMALRRGGRVSLMGGIGEDVGFPYQRIMRFNLKLQGKWMYDREDRSAMLKTIESGKMKLGAKAGMQIVGSFSLEEWEKAFDLAAKNASFGKLVVFKVSDE